MQIKFTKVELFLVATFKAMWVSGQFPKGNLPRPWLNCAFICNIQAIGEKVNEQRDLQKQGQDIQLELKEMDHKVTKFQRDSKDAATKVWLPFDNNQDDSGGDEDDDDDDATLKFLLHIKWS